MATEILKPRTGRAQNYRRAVDYTEAGSALTTVGLLGATTARLNAINESLSGGDHLAAGLFLGSWASADVFVTSVILNSLANGNRGKAAAWGTMGVAANLAMLWATGAIH